MIRPRIGDFVFTIDELAVMLEDISIFAKESINGVVIGVLRTDGTVDVERARMWVHRLIINASHSG